MGEKTIYTKYKNQAWEYCDTAKDDNDLKHLLKEYKMAYGCDFSFKVK